MINSYDLDNTITNLDWNPMQDLLAIIRQNNDQDPSQDSQALIIDTKTHQIIKLDQHVARGIDWSPDGLLVAIGDGEGNLHINNPKGKRVDTIETGQKAITALSWHPQHAKIVTVGSHIEIIDIMSRKIVKTIPREIEVLMLTVAWNPDGKSFATGDYGNLQENYLPLIQLWDYDGEKLNDITDSKSEIRNLCWDIDEKNIITASDKIRLWNSSGILPKSSSMQSYFGGLDNSTESRIVSSTRSGEVIIFDESLQKICKTLQRK